MKGIAIQLTSSLAESLYADLQPKNAGIENAVFKKPTICTLEMMERILKATKEEEKLNAFPIVMRLCLRTIVLNPKCGPKPFIAIAKSVQIWWLARLNS